MRRAAAAVLVAAGVLALADAAVTLAWQEPLSALRTAGAQRELRAELDARWRALPATARAVRHGARALRRDATTLRRGAPDGAAVARLRVPRLGLDTVVVRGARPNDLHRAPGLFGAALPGEGATVAIAGHRTTYGAPFRHIDRLRRGDRVTVALPYATFRYAVTGRRVVDPGEVSVLARSGRERLVLTACHPLFSAARRMVVYARLVGVGRTARMLKRTASWTR
jgi:sortase A